MEYLRRGSTGAAVDELQERLRRFGFDRPGEFGPVTDFAVRSFQEATGLLPDGIVGPRTREVLDRLEAGEAPAADEPALEGLEDLLSGPEIDRTLRLPASQLVLEVFPKDLIVLHHTVGASARSTFEHWRSTPARIATAYLVERDGTIFELFDPRFWAYHLGVVGDRSRIDRRSIGIEIASEGPLAKEGDAYFAFRDPREPDRPGRRYRGEVVALGESWRGERYFAAYTAEQVAAVAALIDHLCTLFGIPRRTPANHVDHDPDLVRFRGVIGHHHVRRDKTDPHPGFPWHELIERARLTHA